LYAWLLLPVALLAYHFGPGQASRQRDEIARQLSLAAQAEQREDWNAARRAYAQALSHLPGANTRLRNGVRVAQAKARMYSGEIVEAIGDLKILLAEIDVPGADPTLRDDVRDTLGTAEYYVGWLMRLEGAPPEEWSAEVENARQHFHLLSQDTSEVTPASASQYQQNLEAAIRLSRIELSELRGLPLPKFCLSCRDVREKCKTQAASRSTAPK
jgi:hypothetical protein